MTEQEAVKIIECAKAEVEWNCPLDYAIAFEMAIEALEKQIPKKTATKSRDGMGYTYYDRYCPCCGKFLCTEIEYEDGYRTNYCDDCGQKLDWSEEE